jgi:hypothetical protein
MNYNQQVQGYKCNGCFGIIPTGKEERHYLDDNRGIKMGCVLCPGCSYSQYSTKKMMGSFPLLILAGNGNNEPKEIITPEFKKHEEAEIKAQQEELKNIRQSSSLFGCDKCSKPIAYGEEKEYFSAKYKPNTSIISGMRQYIFCPPCEKPLYKDLAPNTTFSQVENVKKTPTFIRYQEHKEKLKDQANPTAKWEKQVEEERQAMLKKEQEK